MKIAILGAGNIGATLGGKWLAAGHEVRFGVRDVNSPKTSTALERAQGAQVDHFGLDNPPAEVAFIQLLAQNDLICLLQVAQ